jgi:hypothetical protein
MGLVRELVDEIIPLPKQMDSTFENNNEVVSVYRLSYAFINLLFQCIDCVVIPAITLFCFIGALNLGWVNWVIIILGGIASIFSLFQSLYYIILPPEKYLNPISGRIFGETAIGAFIAAIFKIKIITFIK